MLLFVRKQLKMKLSEEYYRKLENSYKQETLEKYLIDVLTNIESNVELFETLLCSYPSRLQALGNVNGEKITYRSLIKSTVRIGVSMSLFCSCDCCCCRMIVFLRCNPSEKHCSR